MSINDLIIFENKLQPFLKEGEYTFIAPIDTNLLGEFVKKANRIAPGNFFDDSIHPVMSNKEATKQALFFFPATGNQIYVVDGNTDGNTLLYTSAKDYCERNQINLQ